MIQNIPGETALVVAGAWNTAILTPEWVLQHGLGRAGEERVQVLLPAGPGVVFEFPRYTLGNFSYVVRPDALVVAAPETTQGQIEPSEDAVARMLEVLRHTPVTGVGHNFEFRDEEPSSEHWAVFTASRQDLAGSVANGWEPAASSITSSFRNQAGNVIINITRVFDAGVIVVKFNFHHAVASVDQALQILRGQSGYSRMWVNYNLASALMKTIYGEKNND